MLRTLWAHDRTHPGVADFYSGTAELKLLHACADHRKVAPPPLDDDDDPTA